MKSLIRNTRGFTMLEVLIVLVILAVMAGLAVPAYNATVEKSRSQEALSMLGAARQSALRYFAQNGTYVGIANDCSNLDYNPNTAAGGQTAIFTYAASNQAAAAITLTATRVGGPVGTVSINQAGTVTRTGVYA